MSAGCTNLPEPVFYPDQPHLKVVTYNVNWGFAQPQNVVDYLAKTNADVVCLQETHWHWEIYLKQHLGRPYPYRVFKESAGAGGVAIMSKSKIFNAQLIDPNQGWFPALYAEAESPIGKVQFLNVHLRPPLSDDGSASASAIYKTPEIHLKEIQQFVAATEPDRPLIITGDFNEDERGRAVQWLISEDFTDALSMYDAYSGTWTWPVFSGLRLKNRYDHIMFNEYLNCTGARVTHVEASDHMPVEAVVVRK